MPRPFNPLHRVRGATRKKHADDDGIEVEDKHRDGDEEDDEHEREPRDKKHKKKKEKHHRAHDEEADDDDDDDDDDDGDLPSSTKAESCLGCLDPLGAAQRARRCATKLGQPAAVLALRGHAALGLVPRPRRARDYVVHHVADPRFGVEPMQLRLHECQAAKRRLPGLREPSAHAVRQRVLVGARR